MITPSFSPTATERVLPRMALDFTTGVLDSRVTVTRALDTATRVNSSGYIEGVNANLPRFDYNPVTLAPKGLLIEESRTNLVRYSQELDNPIWTKIRATVTANATTSPNNTVDADKLVENTDNNTHYVEISPTAAAAVHSFSVFLKAGERTWARLVVVDGAAYFNLSTGAVGTVSAGTVSLSALTPVDIGNGWYRCTVVFTPSAGAVVLQIRLATSNGGQTYLGDGTSGIFAWGAQLEAGAFPTSYIPTTTTSLTRNADVVSMTGTNFSDWYNASEGTFVAGIRLNALVTPNVKPVFAAYDGTFNTNRAYLNIGVSGQSAFLVNSGGSSQATLAGPILTASNLMKVSGKYKVNDFALAANGVTPATDTSGLVPVGSDRLDIGVFQPASVYLNGHMAFINYYPLGLTTNEVRAFSK